MRVFIAVDIEKDCLEKIERLQEELWKKAELRKGDVTLVKPEAMHLTLKFLGEVDDEAVVDVCKATEEAVGECKRFELGIEGVGSFGGESPKVVWIGTKEGSEELCRMQEEIEDRLAAIGFGRENREFAGHLTLCRVKNFKAGLKLSKAIREYKNYRVAATAVESVCVYASELTSAGPRYTVLKKCVLK